MYISEWMMMSAHQAQQVVNLRLQALFGDDRLMCSLKNWRWLHQHQSPRCSLQWAEPQQPPETAAAEALKCVGVFFSELGSEMSFLLGCSSVNCVRLCHWAAHQHTPHMSEITALDNSHGPTSCKSDEGIMRPVYMQLHRALHHGCNQSDWSVTVNHWLLQRDWIASVSV